jgi:hypothetical protein
VVGCQEHRERSHVLGAPNERTVSSRAIMQAAPGMTEPRRVPSGRSRGARAALQIAIRPSGWTRAGACGRLRVPRTQSRLERLADASLVGRRAGRSEEGRPRAHGGAAAIRLGWARRRLSEQRTQILVHRRIELSQALGSRGRPWRARVIALPVHRSTAFRHIFIQSRGRVGRDEGARVTEQSANGRVG